ncbi:MAG: hypothetical protein PUD81_08780, partial [Eggerthellales bacterium]|nr:hypothetical protein [Eggerthellales bacterium]
QKQKSPMAAVFRRPSRVCVTDGLRETPFIKLTPLLYLVFWGRITAPHFFRTHNITAWQREENTA